MLHLWSGQKRVKEAVEAEFGALGMMMPLMMTGEREVQVVARRP